MPDRKSALEYLKRVAETADANFFSVQDDKDEQRFVFEGVELKVTRRSYSRAQPTTITFDIDLGPCCRRGRTLALKDTLVIYVLNPNERNLEANRAAYQRCIDSLIANNASFTAQSKATQ